MKTDLTWIIVGVVLAGLALGIGKAPTARGEDRLEWLYQGQPFDYWREQLQAQPAEQRTQAVRAVGSFQQDRPKQVRSLLLGMLDDPSPGVRKAAVGWLSLARNRSRLGGSEVVINALTERLTDPAEDPQVRQAAADGLGNLEIAGAKALAAAIGQIDDVQVRAEAIEELSTMPRDLHDEIMDINPVREALQQLQQERQRRRAERGDRSALLRKAIERVEQPQARAYALQQLKVADRIGDIVVDRLVLEVNRKDAPAIVRMRTLRHLLPWSDHKAAEGAVDALAAGLKSEDDRLHFWAASALAAIDPRSEVSDRAVKILVDRFVEDIRTDAVDSEQLYATFLFATAWTDRRGEIFRRIIAGLDDEKKIAAVQESRFSLSEDIGGLTPELLVSFLKYEDAYLRQDVAGELAGLGPSVAKQAAPALAEVLKYLPADSKKARQVARAVVEALTKIDPEAQHTPRLDAETLIRLVYLGISKQSSVHQEWVAEQFRRHGEAIIEDLVEVVQGLPTTRNAPRLENNLAERRRSSRFIRMLAQLGKPAVPALKRLLIQHADDYRGRQAAAALGQIEPAGMQVLIELAEHGDDAVRKCILSPSGGWIRGFDAALVAAAGDENADAEVRKTVIQWFYGKHDADVREAIVRILIETLQHEDLEIAEDAAFALRRLRDVKPKAIVAACRSALQRDEPRLNGVILSVLRSFGEEAAAALPEIRKLIEHREEHGDALETIAAMGPAAEQAEDLLRQELDSSNRNHRFWAAVALSRFEEGVEAAVPVLIDVLQAGGRTQGNDRNLRVLAAETLGRIGPEAEAAIEPLLELARLRPDVEPPQADVIEVGNDPDETSDAAAEAHLELQQQVDVGNDPDEVYKIMEAAVAALGKIGRQPEKVVPVLTDLLDLEGWRAQNVTRQAVIALRSFGADAQPATEELIRRLDGGVRISPAGKTLLAIGKPAVPALADALDEDLKIARLAAQLLGKLGATAAPAAPELMNVVRDRGVSWHVREAAITALGRIGKPARPAIPYLEALAQTPLNPHWMDENLAEAARRALKRIRNGP